MPQIDIKKVLLFLTPPMGNGTDLKKSPLEFPQLFATYCEKLRSLCQRPKHYEKEHSPFRK